MKKKEMADLLRKIYSQQIPTTVIDEAKPLKDEDHPTMKPVRLIGYLMSNSSKVGDIVLDTFGGSGTTLIAAEQLGRKCYMMELDPHYCDVIIARWEKMTGKEARKLWQQYNLSRQYQICGAPRSVTSPRGTSAPWESLSAWKIS